MPTENRSSNTEMVSELLPCPFCGQQDFLIERLDSDASVVICQGLTGPHEACLARGPVGVAQDEGEEQPGRDKAVELWNARAEQHQGEPAAYQFQGRDGKWYGFTNERHYQNTLADGTWPIRPLYTHADPGEVERLQFELSETMAIANGQTSLRKEEAEDWAKERDTLRAQLAERDALITRVVHSGALTCPDYSELEAECCALSASAEPSAPVERDERADCENCDDTGLGPCTVCAALERKP
nr:Lar family restriction alleviation protein [Pseudomonas mosselii]